MVPEYLKPVTVVAIALPLIVLVAWANLAIHRHYKLQHREHPDRRPYGWNLLLRLAPFMVLMAALTVWAVMDGEVLIGALGVLGLAGFSSSLVRYWRPPTPGDTRGPEG